MARSDFQVKLANIETSGGRRLAAILDDIVIDLHRAAQLALMPGGPARYPTDSPDATGAA